MKNSIFLLMLVSLLFSCGKEDLTDSVFDANETQTKHIDATNFETDGPMRASCPYLYTTPVDVGVLGGWQLVDLLNCHGEQGTFTHSRYLHCNSPLETVYLSGEGSENALYTWASNDCETDWNTTIRSSIISGMWDIVRDHCPNAVIVDVEFFVNFCPCGQSVYDYHIGFEATVCCDPELSPWVPKWEKVEFAPAEM